MTTNQAINRADGLRPNAIDKQTKLEWLMEIEGQLRCFMELDPLDGHLSEDVVLCVSPPFDNIYYLYLCARIDHAQQDSDLYFNDSVMFNGALERAKQWHRQHNLPKNCGNWRIG